MVLDGESSSGVVCKHFCTFQRHTDVLVLFLPLMRPILITFPLQFNGVVNVQSVVSTTTMAARLKVQLPPKPCCCVLG